MSKSIIFNDIRLHVSHFGTAVLQMEHARQPTARLTTVTR